MHAHEDSPLLVLAREKPRLWCEQNYLRSHANVEVISDHPVISLPAVPVAS